MIKWECQKCKATWWCAGYLCPECPDCGSEMINPTGEEEDEDVDSV